MNEKYDGGKTIPEYDLNQQAQQQLPAASPEPIALFPKFPVQAAQGSASSVTTRDLISIERHLAEIGTIVNAQSEVLERLQSHVGEQSKDVVRIDSTVKRVCEDTEKVSTKVDLYDPESGKSIDSRMATLSIQVDTLLRWKWFVITSSVVLLVAIIGALGLVGKVIWSASADSAKVTSNSSKLSLHDTSIKSLSETNSTLERRLDKLGEVRTIDPFTEVISTMTKEQERVLKAMLCDPVRPARHYKR